MTHWAPPHTLLSSHSFTSVEKKEHPSRQPSSAVGPGPWPEVGLLAHTVLAVLGLLVARVTEASEGAQQVLTVAVSATQCLVEATLVDICVETQRRSFLRPESPPGQLRAQSPPLMDSSLLWTISVWVSAVSASGIFIPDLLPPKEQLSIYPQRAAPPSPGVSSQPPSFSTCGVPGPA